FSSFISAMQRLGGGIIPLNGMSNTSVAKGETLEDTARVFSAYADVIVMRHPQAGACKIFAKYAGVPVINAGDGIGEHPTQALIDLYTIKEELGRITKLHIMFIGDLAHYRPVNSLAKLMSLYPEVTFTFATPQEVSIQDSLREYLNEKKINYNEISDFTDVLPVIDVLYITRVKKEYMSRELYRRIKGSYIVNKDMANKMKKKSLIMHCLPRVDEISLDLDNDPRSVYFSSQLSNGLFVRMAILEAICRK
ncbi:MAG: aspartate carbamoyltransferase, partial [Patescibacteria group bacterium]